MVWVNIEAGATVCEHVCTDVDHLLLVDADVWCVIEAVKNSNNDFGPINNNTNQPDIIKLLFNVSTEIKCITLDAGEIEKILWLYILLK